MATMTIRKIPDEVHNALKARAINSGRSLEAEVRFILKEALISPQRISLDDVFAEFRRRTGGIDLGDLRSKELAEPLDFSERE